jgi:hypothetical protein
MGITSKTFIVLLALAALALFAVTVWLWPRLATSTSRAISGRVGLLVTSQLLLLAVVAAFVNAYFGFYTSWSDLFGAGSQRYHVNDKGAVAANVNASQLTSGSTSGSITTTTLTGLRSGITARLRVYVPPHPQPSYPAIVIDATGEQTAAADATALSSNAAHPIQALVVIVDTANGSTIPCTDQPGGAQGGQFWAQDLRSAIAARYSVGLSAASWGVLAAGPDASCALQFALADSTRYSAAAAINPTPGPSPSSPNPSAANPSSAAFNPSSWLATYPAPPSRILLAGVSGSPDSVLGQVRPPLQATATGNTDTQSALTWLAQTLNQGAKS